MVKLIPEYPYQGAPENLKTRRQLADLGLRPGGQAKGRIYWKRGKRYADLFEVAEALPKKQPTPAQLAALEKANIKRRTCPRCGTVFDFVIPGDWQWNNCNECYRRARKAEVAHCKQLARVWLASPRSVILDTETTGLHNALLTEIAIINPAGEVLFNTRLNPMVHIPPDATRIHGISNADVDNAPTYEQIADQIDAILKGKRVITYNAAFDSGVIANELARRYITQTGESDFFNALSKARAKAKHSLRTKAWRCAMELYAVWWGEWSVYHESYKYQRLPGGNHSAIGDALACRDVLRLMAEEE